MLETLARVKILEGLTLGSTMDIVEVVATKTLLIMVKVDLMLLSEQGIYEQRAAYGRSSLYCDYYHFKGHTRDTCYKLHGYPTDLKKKKGGQSHNHASNATFQGNYVNDSVSSNSTGSSFTGIPAPAPLFTHEQYNQILRILSK
ncbi:hypothetical protein P3S68_027070 [Capsicum galapagoense]